jgi:hypothetical protein
VNAPTLTELAAIYRENLYDSRSQGRYLLEQRLMDRFADIYQELVSWATYIRPQSEVSGIQRHELLTFPKFRKVAKALQGIDGIIGEIDGHTLVKNGRVYTWQQDPIIGAIVRNKNFYKWTVKEVEYAFPLTP